MVAALAATGGVIEGEQARQPCRNRNDVFCAFYCMSNLSLFTFLAPLGWRHCPQALQPVLRTDFTRTPDRRTLSKPVHF